MMMANNNSSDVKTAPGDGGGGGGDDGGGGGGGGGGPGGGGSGGSDSAGGDNSEVNIRRGLDVIQSMIDISADRLEGLRTQCATSAELTQQEIRTLETKLVKLFSDLLITKSKLPERLPAQGLPATGNELKQWLRVVGKFRARDTGRNPCPNPSLTRHLFPFLLLLSTRRSELCIT